MKKAQWMRMAVSLLLFVGALSADRAGAQRQRQPEPECEVEAAACGDGLNELDAGRGEVSPGISIFAVRGTMEMMRLHGWANALIEQAADLAELSSLDQQEQFQAMRFTVRTVRELIRARRPGAETLDLNGLEFEAGVLERKSRSRERGRRDYRDGRSERLLVPYVALRAKTDRKDWRQQDSVPWQQESLPPAAAQQQQVLPDESAEPLNAFRLTNTARRISSDRWEWTAFIDGPAPFLRRISSVTYHLHSTFNPRKRQGDSARLGHPLTAVGWGSFLLRADVVLDDGTQRSYEHTLQFH